MADTEMTEPQAAEERGWERRARRAVLQVAVLVVFVPLGVWLGWQMMAPSAERLALHAVNGADKAALLELVLRAQKQPEAEEILQELVFRDAGALNALAELASGHEEALQCLISLARKQPDSLALLADWRMSYPFALGLLRQMGAAVIPRLKEFAEIYPNACFMLGVASENGCHVQQSWAEAALWYGRAWSMGYFEVEPYHAEAAYNAGLQEEDAAQKASWFESAAICHHAAAQCALGVCYAAGEGVEQNLEKAVEWYARSAAQGFCDAQFNLGWCYLYGEGCRSNAAVAVSLFRDAAWQGDDLAQYYVGRAYELGQGVKQDFAEAVRWYGWAVEQGNAAAQCALGHCLAQGRGVAQDWAEAVRLYRLAAAQGRSEALLALAYCYEHGYGVAQDAAAARYWRERAAKESQSTIPES